MSGSVSLKHLAILLIALPACSGASIGGTSTCNAVYNCGTGETCATLDGHSFSCMPAGTSKLDDRCDASTTAVTCGEGLGCLGTGVPTSATCVAWCGGLPTCPADKTCTSVTTTLGATLEVCVPCNTVYTCGAGQTCSTVTGQTFSCMPSGAGRAGDPCDATVGAPNICGDRLVCLAKGVPTAGTCTSWCDKIHPCSGGKTCQVVLTTMGLTLPLCI
jgi:hypothetical protein